MDTYIFNIEFNRSGTTSLTKALNILGIKSLHYSTDNSGWFEGNKNELGYIISQNYAQNRKLLDGLDEDVRGFSDFMGRLFYKTLYEQYPQSKFILTIRSFDSWLNSLLTMKRKHNQFPTAEAEEYERIELTNRYWKYKKEISEFFKDKPDCYLEMNIVEGDGWEVLCNFLGKEIPKTPFPYLNQQKTIKDQR